MIYDIRNRANAMQTLVDLTGVDIFIWTQHLKYERNYRYTCDFVKEVINKFGHMPSNRSKFEYVFFQVTTSANGGAYFRKNGIIDLQQSVVCQESELREFLFQHNIQIEMHEKILKYRVKGTCQGDVESDIK